MIWRATYDETSDEINGRRHYGWEFRRDGEPVPLIVEDVDRGDLGDVLERHDRHFREGDVIQVQRWVATPGNAEYLGHFEVERTVTMPTSFPAGVPVERIHDPGARVQCDKSGVNVHGRAVRTCRVDAEWRIADGSEDSFCEDHIMEYARAYADDKETAR